VADRFLHAQAARAFREYWNGQGEKLPPDMRIPTEGLDAVLVELPQPDTKAPAPFVCLTFPAAIRPSEVHFMAISADCVFELVNDPRCDDGDCLRRLRLHELGRGSKTKLAKFAATREAFLEACANWSWET
jgi:hypothetical protein